MVNVDYTYRNIQIVFLAMAILFSLSYNFWGIGLSDAFFWVNISSFYEDYPMTTLSLWTINKWVDLLGYSLLNVRLFAWTINIISIIIPYFLLLDKNSWNKYSHYLGLAILTIGPGMQKCLSPDTFTTLCTSIIMVCAYKYAYCSKKCTYLIALALLSSIATAVRFPNVLFVPVLILLFLYINRGLYKLFTQIIVFFVIFCVIYLSIMHLLTGNWDIIGLLHNEISMEAGNSNGRHSLLGLILRYMKSVVLCFVTISLIFSTFWLIGKKRIQKPYVKFLSLTVVTTVILCCYLHYTDRMFFWFPVIIAFIAVPLLWIVITDYKSNKELTKEHVMYLILIILCFIPSAGSDTGFAKSMINACAIIPFTVVALHKSKYNHIIIAAFYSICALTSSFIFTENMLNCKKYSSTKQLCGILCDPNDINWIDGIYKDILKFHSKNHTIIYGGSAHELYFLLETKPLYHYGYWMEKNDLVEIEKIVDIAKRNQESTIIDLSNSEETLFLKKGLKLVEKGNSYSIYRGFK